MYYLVLLLICLALRLIQIKLHIKCPAEEPCCLWENIQRSTKAENSMQSLGVFAQDFCCYFHLCKCVTIGCHEKEIYVHQFQDWSIFLFIYIFVKCKDFGCYRDCRCKPSSISFQGLLYISLFPSISFYPILARLNYTLLIDSIKKI